MSSVLVPPNFYKHFMRPGTLELMSEFANILAFCKSLLDDSDDTKPNMHLWLAVSALQSYASEALEMEGHISSHLPLIQFIMEQLKLIQVPKNGRRYSTAVITTSFLWQLTSTSLYKKLKDFLFCPLYVHSASFIVQQPLKVENSTCNT